MGTLLRFVWFYKKLLISNLNEVFLRVESEVRSVTITKSKCVAPLASKMHLLILNCSNTSPF